MKYEVLERFIAQNGKQVFEKGDLYKVTHCGDFTYRLLQNGFIKRRKENDFGSWEKNGKRSELAKVIIAPEDYAEGEKKFFTWEEACAIKDKLDNGWRLPTRSEWVLICEEFGQKNGRLDSETLKRSLDLSYHGFMNMSTGSLRDAGYDGNYWSSTAYASGLYAFDLDFNSTNVYPSNNASRWLGFTVRLVKDVEG